MVRDKSNIVRIGKEKVSNVSNTDFPGYDPSKPSTSGWTEKRFKEQMACKVVSLSPSAIEFDLVGVDASFANAVRRIIIAEVPTVAVETVYMWQNTSIIQDEVLAHRLGLIPLAVDPRKLQYRRNADSPESAPTDVDTIVFNLIASCDRVRGFKREEGVEYKPEELYTMPEVLSGHLEFDPKGDQEVKFAGKNRPRPAGSEVLLAKLRPKQEIIAELHCVKGKGKDHAKYSPAATCSYRLLPTIDIRSPIEPAHAAKFAACFPPGVVKVSNGVPKVVNPRADTVSREVLRHAEFEGKVELGRAKDHFIFSVESAGQYTPEELVSEGLGVLLEKIRNARKALEMVKKL